MKRLFKILFFVAIVSVFMIRPDAVFLPEYALAQDSFQNDANKEIVFFYSTTCPHCREQEKFLDQIEKKYSDIEIKRYEFSKNIDLIQDFYSEYNVPTQEQGFIPVTFMGNIYFVGFSKDIGDKIEEYIQNSFEIEPYSTNKVKVPFWGEVDIENFSLPFLAIIFGFFDGFNICSLGALVLILGIVIALKSKKKILILGGAFILITSIIYWLMVFLWNRLFVFLAPYIRNMEILIGILAGVGAWYFFREFLKSRKGMAVCKFGGISEKLSEKVNNALENKTGILAMIGVVFLFATAITIIEFPCTAFFPVLFTGILAKTGAPLHLSAFYIGIYVFFYMLDELIVLLVAVFTMKIWVASPKVMTWLNFFASALLFVFGFYYLIWPIAKVWFNF
jgi:thiol-disulfide isomerase/thioredoxin